MGLAYGRICCLLLNNINRSGMAGRVDGNKIIRMIHLISSIIVLVFLMMYTFTGILMTHHNLPFGESEVSWSKIPVDKPMDSSPAAYSRYLKDQYGYRGNYSYRQSENGNWDFHFDFPGEQVNVTLHPAQDTLYIKHTGTERTLMTVAQNLHGMRGFSGSWVYAIWAIFYDLSAVALILFGITGIIMWLKQRKWYPSGWWYLCAGVIIPLMIVFAFLFSR